MTSTQRWWWTSSHILLGALLLFVFHALLTKRYGHESLLLGAWLAAGFGIVAINREVARRVAPIDRSRLMRLWAGLDGPGLVFLIALLILLVVSDVAQERATADGREYFVQVRSLVIDHDLDLANDMELFRTPGNAHMFPFGSAVLWLPFFVAAHLWLGLLNLLGGTYPRTGFDNPYQMAVGLGTLLYGFAGLLLINRIVRDYFSRWTAAMATLLLTFGSFLVWYLAVEGSYAHGNSLFATSLFIYVWYRTRRQRSVGQWAALGAAGGLMTMVRWQNAVFLVFAAVDAMESAWHTARGIGRREAGDAENPSPPGAFGHRWPTLVRQTGAFSAGLLLGVFPQLVFWKVVNGGWLALPHGQSGQQWWSDALVVDVLFSSNHGLLSWHPLIYLALLGVPLFVLRDARFGFLLAGVFAIQVYVNAAVATWWGGHAFGARRFESCMLLFVLGLAALMTWAKKRPRFTTCAVLGLFVALNIVFMIDVKRGSLPTSEGIGADQLLSSAYRKFGNPFSFPGNLWFGWRYGIDAWQYDQLGLRMYNNLVFDVGTNADARFLGLGWGHPEATPDGTYRWAVGPRSVLVAPLRSETFLLPGQPQEQADYLMRFRAQPFRYPDAPPQSIELRVNGELAARLLLAAETRDYTVDVARQLLRRNLNVFEFRYAYARSPADAGTGDDTRPLAVRFERMELLRQPG